MSRDINRILAPGEEVAVQATGDYVYCKAATVPIHLAMDQQVVEMVAGDKLREPSRFKAFKLENRSPDTYAYVTLVVGDGDYMRQIVQGELAVQPKLMTEDGTLREDSRYWLSLFIRPQPGYSPQTYSYCDTVKDYGSNTTGADTNYRISMEWIPTEEIWMVRERDGMTREFTPEWEFIREYQGPNSNSYEEQLFTLEQNGLGIFYIDGGTLRYSPDRTATGSGTGVMGSSPGGNSITHWDDDVASVGDDLLFFSAADNSSVWRAPMADVKAGTAVWSRVTEGMGVPAGQIVVGGGKLHVLNANNPAADVYDLQTGGHLYGTNPGFIVPAGGFRAGLLYLWNDSDDTITATWAGEGPDTVNVKAIAEPLECRRPAGMIDTGAWQFTMADISASAGLMGEINATGEIIRAALALYTGEVDAPDGYLDHVYAVTLNTGTGKAKKAVRANQTFAAAGLADDFRMTIPGAIHIQIDAQLFNEA